MKASLFYGPQDIHVEEVDKPVINENELLVKVHVGSICGTDLRIFKFGHFKIDQKRVLGHELAGEVVEVGANVKDFELGNRISVAPNVGCGHCRMCKKGYNQLCSEYEAFGISYDGGFQEYMKVPQAALERGNVFKVPENLSYVEAALVEPFSCTYNSYKALNTRPGDTVVIIGAGPIGACHVLINKLAGATKIIVADVAASRLTEMKKIGADVTVLSSEEDLNARVLEETNGAGADVVITACSVPAVQQQALEIAAVHGRVNFFGGMPKGKEFVTLNTNLLHYKELIVLGTTGSSIENYQESMDIVASKKVDLLQLATHSFSLEQINDAFAFAQSGEGMKTYLNIVGE